jgi:hypothetical protein
MLFLRQSTASQEVLLGPFVDDTDGKTAETGLTIANTDIKLWVEGATTEASKTSGGATHIASGRYYAVLDATDTATVGKLEINVHVAGALPVRREFHVLEEAVYDSMFAAAAAGYQVPIWAAANSTVNLSGTTVKAVTDKVAATIAAGDIATDAVDAASVKADAVTKIQNGLATPTNITAGTITTVTNLTNAPTTGDLTATMKTSVNTEVAAALATYDGPTNAEMVARTVAAADYATAAELAKVPKSDGTATWNSTALASINAEADTALSDYAPLKPTTAGRTLDVTATGAAGIDWGNVENPMTTVGLSGTTIYTATNLDAAVADVPTVAEFNARTLLAASYATPTNITAGTITTVTNLTNAPPDSSGVTTLLSRIPSGIFSGITSLAQWLGLIAGKQVGDTTARTELRATGAGSGTFDETTDSVEALRDRGDAAWITATGFATAAELAKVPKSDSTVTWNATALGSINSEVASALGTYDPPTNAEMNARTLVAADYATATNLATVDTVVDGIKVKTDQFVFTVANQVDANALSGGGSGLDAAGVRSALGMSSANLDTQLGTIDTVVDAVKAKTDNLPASPAATGDAMTLTTGERTAIANEVEAQIIDDTDSEKVLQAIIDKIAAANPSLDDLTLGAIASAVRTELAVELARIDAAITTRLASASYTAPPSAATNASAVRTELATELARVDAAVSTRATPAQVATELATYDGPTNAEFEARTLPSESYAEPGDAMTLAASEDVYPAILKLVVDGANDADEYTVQWFNNTTPVSSGITVPTIRVIKRADGTDLIATSVMTQIGSTGAYKYNAITTERVTAGEDVIAEVRATIDGSVRIWREVLGRDAEVPA